MRMDCRGDAKRKLQELQGGGRMPTMRMGCREDTDPQVIESCQSCREEAGCGPCE